MGDIEEYFDYLLSEGIIKNEGEYYTIDLDEIGVDEIIRSWKN
ncbi:hypothetical protein [Candidatus Nanopusillus massiliensis]|nr:hypothetical protein [Candidatus Nanopusillus massiliensis]